MASCYECGWVKFNPDLNDSCDMETGEGIYRPSDYPLSVPEVYLEGERDEYFPQFAFDWIDDAVVVVRGAILTKYTKHHYSELLAEDENGNIIWVDGRTAPYEGCWKGKYLNEVRGALEYDVEEFDLDTLDKKTYKVTLDSISKMDLKDYNQLVNYIDPEVIKKFNIGKDTKTI